MLVISPPFGNYVSLPCTLSIRGSYTLQPRDGLFQQIVKTLRYSFEHRGWVNKIGLRNKGIDYAISKYKANKDENIIYSIAILEENDIIKMNEKIPKNMPLEINVSCPNAEKKMIQEGLRQFITPHRKWCMLKLSPHVTNEEIDSYYRQGFRQFHCSNTVPCSRGGVSGAIVRPYTNKNMKYIKSKYDDCVVVAGGGVTKWNHVEEYKYNGADYVSMSTIFFCPYNVLGVLYNYYMK